MVLAQELSFSWSSEEIAFPRLLQSLTNSTNSEESRVRLFFKERIKESSAEEESNEIISNTKTPSKLPSYRVQTTQSVDLDITGSPLKAGFDPNEVFDNTDDDLRVIARKPKLPDFSGLDVKCGRTLLSRFNCQDPAPDCQTNAVLCQPDDRSNILYLGNRFADGRLASVWRTTWEGPLPGRTLASGSMEAILRKLGLASGGGARQDRTVATSRADYLLTGEQLQSCLMLQCSWDRSTAILETPPPDSTTRLSVTLDPADRRFACDRQSIEIEQLEGLISGLAGQGLVWAGREEEDTSLEQQVIEVLEASRKIKPSYAMLDSESENVLSLEARQDVDITDMLWSVLSQAQSYSELTDCLSLVFSTILAEEIRPFIYSGNKSGMAGIIRDLIRTGNLPDLTGSKPLSLLIEMGVEKLARDSSHFLLSSDLASKEAVDPYLVKDDYTRSVELIKRLHSVVELTFACQTYLSLPPPSLKALVHVALAKFIDLDTNQRIQLEFPIQTADVKNQLESGQPVFWQMRLENEAVTSVAQLQLEKPVEIFPTPPPPPASSSQDDDNDLHYYLILHSEIKQDM